MRTSNSTIVIWDYDGTLVDTRQKNLNVTRRIVEAISGSDWKTYPALATLEAYARANTNTTNWRDFYAKNFSLSVEQIDEAGKVWSEFQRRDSTSSPLIDGIKGVVPVLGMQGIVSQNSSDMIRRVLAEHELLQYFPFIVGYEEVDIRRQKPEPDGLLRCIEALQNESTNAVMYVGDHETDARCAMNANAALQSRGSRIRVVSVAAVYSDHADTSGWSIKAECEARTAGDILEIANREHRR